MLVPRTSYFLRMANRSIGRRYFLGKEVGLQATQLYAFCRYLDDIADQPDNLGATKLKSIQNIFNNYSYQTGSCPEVDNFLLLKQELDLPVLRLKICLKGLLVIKELFYYLMKIS